MVVVPCRLLSIVVFVLICAPIVELRAQVPNDKPENAAKARRVARIMEMAEKHFVAGQEAFAAKNRARARIHFDQAIDVILDSGIDVRDERVLQRYYLELIERIYQVEVPTVATRPGQDYLVSVPGPTEENGFTQQEFIPAPNERLAKVLTAQERKVNAVHPTESIPSATDIDFHFTPNPLIQQFINYYTGPRGRRTMELGLERSGMFTKMARRIFREEGVPEDLVWLGQVASGWQVKPSGLWRIYPKIGAHFGLRQTPDIDERNSYEQAARGAARYLKFLASRYHGNWELALAANHAGAIPIDSAITNTGMASLWQIMPRLEAETRNYVPNVMAVILIAKNPAKYGFGHVRPMPPLVYDAVQVPTATSLKLIADASGTTVEVIRELNPELRRDTTPRGESYNVRIPPGRAQQFVAILKRVPVDRRDADGVTPNTINPPESTRAETGSSDTIIAVPGDTIAKIAARYGFNVNDLVRLNGISAQAELRAGRVIRTAARRTPPQ